MVRRFLLDGMLGALSRWLRILGFDTLYYVDKDDEELILEAKATGRVLVTRDVELHKRATKHGLKSFLIDSDDTMEQLNEITTKLELNLEPKNTKCPKCNGELRPIEKELVRGFVPPESYEVFNEFWKCEACGAVYWKGSHWDKIQETLNLIDSS
ncbi:hypothetical protein GF326_09885 [Candidatus Bathyarchaeota archaeon]|nr:hypothetical protein [Candidatus Bathyarchaeota archaeon]